MTILVNEKTPVLVQGITGKSGSYHALLMKKFGTNIVAGVSPSVKKSGVDEIEGITIYSTVKEACDSYYNRAKKKIEWSIMFVPASNAKTAALSALNNGLNLVIITEGIPVHDAMEIMRLAKQKKRMVIGPNCPGIICPGKALLGITPVHVAVKGNVGVISRSGTLTYEILNELKLAGMGVSTAVGIGGDTVIGEDFIKLLELFEKDDDTEAIVVIGEIGGNLEEKAAEYIKKNIKKPVVAFIAGLTAPKETQMGHAGAIVYGDNGSAESKINAFKQANVTVAKKPSSIVKFLKEKLR